MRDLVRAPAPSLIARPFTLYPGNEDQAAISPDGRHIAFIWDGEQGSGGGDLYVQLVGSHEPLRLTRTTNREHSPEWSPDGTRIAFLRDVGDSTEILSVPALGGTALPIAKTSVLGAEISGLAWSPDGSQLAIVGGEPSHDGLSLFSFADRSLRMLTDPAGGVGNQRDSYPAFSPGGERVAVSRSRGGLRQAVIVTMDGYVQQVLETGANDRHAWAADGNSLIFARRRSHAGELRRVFLSGGEDETLSFGADDSISPTVRGNLLAFTRWRLITNLHSLNLAGGQQAGQPGPMFLESTRREHSPSFSPDGSRVAFVSDRTGAYEIWTCDRNGESLQQLTFFDRSSTGSPKWSPDGRWIAFDSSTADGGNTEIFIVSSAGGEPKQLTHSPAQDRVPSWSRDGKWIYFGTSRTRPRTVWRIPVEGGDAVQVTKDRGFEAIESPDGKRLYYSRGIGLLGIWTLDLETGQEMPVAGLAEAGCWRYWSMSNDAVYFVAGDAPRDAKGPFEMRRFDFGTRLTTHVATIEQSLLWGPSGLAVAPDESALLVTTIDQDNKDIMLVEGFE